MSNYNSETSSKSQVQTSGDVKYNFILSCMPNAWYATYSI